jgi:hypothetical protein
LPTIDAASYADMLAAAAPSSHLIHDHASLALQLALQPTPQAPALLLWSSLTLTSNTSLLQANKHSSSSRQGVLSLTTATQQG